MGRREERTGPERKQRDGVKTGGSGEACGPTRPSLWLETVQHHDDDDYDVVTDSFKTPPI